MSLSPSTRMSRLSLECNSTARPPQSSMPSRHASPFVPGSDTGSESVSDASDWGIGEDVDEDGTDVVSSPTGFKYNISRLSPRTRGVVKGLFNQTSSKEPPQISLELCGLREGGAEQGIFYAFQMHEVVPCSVRIGARDSGRFSAPRCECPDARYRHLRPCKHLIWLFDRIAKQVIIDHDPDAELTLTEFGYAEELGDPFDQISQMRLDVLADDLRCDTSEPDSDEVHPSPARVREAREIVAAVSGIGPCELDDFRPDLEESYDRSTLIRRGDPGATLFSLLLASHSLAEWLRSELLPSDPAADPFRSVQHRVFRIIEELNAYTAAEHDHAVAAAYRTRSKEAEGPRNLSWATGQIRSCVKRLDKLVSRGSNPLSNSERFSAARSLVVILKAVTDHRDLYAELIGDADTGFIYSTLDMLADQSHFIDALEDILDKLGVYGAPPSYVANLRGLVTRMRSYKSEHAGAVSASVPRADTPPLREPSPAAASNHQPNRSPSVQFLTPELPASATGRGGQSRSGRGRGSGRVSKRPLSRGSSLDSSRGSRKRPRGA